jgi:hypothetical protein
MPDVTTVVQDYIATWNEADPERRRALVARTFAEDATYVDPLMAGAGPQEIEAMIAAAQAAYPGHRFELADGPIATTTGCASPGTSWAARGAWRPAWTSRRWARTVACAT